MNKLFLVCTILFPLITLLTVSQQNPNNMNLVETEYAFAEATKNSTVRNGFLKFIDEDGILFRPGPVLGKTFLEKSEARPGLLMWYPTYSIISSSGDLGVNTGPWEFKQELNQDAVAFGQFLTVWEKQPDSTWKFLIDIGIGHSKHDSIERGTEFSNVLIKPNSVNYPNYENILSIEENFVNDIAKNNYSKITNDETIILRNNKFPIKKEEIKEFIPTLTGSLKWETLGGKSSLNNDLAYTYGKGFALAQNLQAVYEFYYLHVWVNENTEWKLRVDVVNEIENN